MTKKILRQIYIYIIIALSIISFMFGNVIKTSADTPSSGASSGAGDLVLYDETKIKDDLADMDIDEIVKLTSTSPCVIRFSEYGYSDSALLKKYFGLYMYVYNPKGEAIMPYGSVANMGAEYSSAGEVVRYENKALTLLDTWQIGNESKASIFKFKVQDSYPLLDEIAKYYKPDDPNSARRYDIAGIQLRWQNNKEEMDRTFGKTYYFKGYAKGCGDADQPLGCTVNSLETIELHPEHTFYRTGDYKDFVCDEINTVYFSIPDKYFSEYGGLQKIKAQWDEYKSKQMFVTSDNDAYNALYSYAGKDIGGDRLDALRWRIMWGEHALPQIDGTFIESPYNNYMYDYAYNPNIDGNKQGTMTDGVFDADMGVFCWGLANEKLRQIDWLFKQGEVGNADSFKVSSKTVEDYMRAYTARYPNQATVGTLKGSYAEGLFEESIDADRLKYLDARQDGSNPNATRGRVTQEIDAGDVGTYIFEKDQSFWDKVFDRDLEYGTENYMPIVEVKEDIRGLAPAAFANQYLINQADAQTVYDYCIGELDKGNHPILFRFAKTDYYSAAARFDCEDHTFVAKQNGYVAQETMFLGFDVISLTFMNALQEESVIPAVSDPMDIINGIEPGSDFTGGSWDLDLDQALTILLGAFLLIVILIACAPLLPYLGNAIILGLQYAIKGIVWVIQLPFKGLALLFEKLFHKEE